MGAMQVECAECGTVARVASWAGAEQAGWRQHDKYDEDVTGWMCWACDPEMVKVVDQAPLAAEEIDQAEREAYDLETCRRFEELSQRLFYADRLAWGPRKAAIQAGINIEVAVLWPARRTVGAQLTDELADAEDYEAL